ncbi:nucleotidyltransferase domain-containing protein [Candidatus Xianfuyuplasma coldseepsis]|uniref:Helix-turn-helix domain-containing protein n=1 Tax=Candidatus Xianfuyuplasma coldseepsis TaxID=2782163 RepID=A0A7L7KNQ1_9MOLU|nr:nucleotidyltransferase domain-containing protein [Xianfuyuplasma coldseepsis]QMS84380.1 helix-turn-helix domain-containing protein [Xianfuyuplasma coldseepsis]
MSIKELRKSLDLTQKQVSELVKIPLRTYLNYENDETKKGTIKYNYIMDKLEEYGYIDEEHGLLTIEKIKTIVSSVLSKYEAEYCYLFGSYAKETATEKSDVDLLLSSSVTGMKFYGLVEELREQLKKKVEVIPVSSLEGNVELLNEILKDGIKIYG